MWHKVPAGITEIHARFRRPLIDIRKEVSLPLLYFQNNNQDCLQCDLSSGQHEFDPLDARHTRRLRLYCHPSEWEPTCSLHQTFAFCWNRRSQNFSRFFQANYWSCYITNLTNPTAAFWKQKTKPQPIPKLMSCF